MCSSSSPVEWKAPSGLKKSDSILVQMEERLDRFLSRTFPQWSRTRWQKEIAGGKVTVNGIVIAEPDYRLKPGDILSPSFPKDEPLILEAKPLPLTLLYADDTIAVLDKPSGLTVHPGAKKEEETLVHGLLHLFPWLKEQGGYGGNLRPGIVHRLDKGTSGVMVVALTEAARLELTHSFQKREVKKRYLAWVVGQPPDSGEWSGGITRDPRDRKRFTVSRNGKPALTRFRVITRYRLGCKLEIEPVTGRTHQIRVHAYHAGFPLFGDPLYCFRSKKHYGIASWGPERQRPALHAMELAFPHPSTREWLTFRSPIPSDLKELDEKLRAL